MYEEFPISENVLARESMVSSSASESASASTFEPYTAYASSIFDYDIFDEYIDPNEAILTNRADKKKELMEIFRQSHCTNGKLMNHGSEVRPEMADHVFREIRFKGEFAKCNPCDPKCSFSIVEERLAMDEYLTEPKDSNADFPLDWNSIFGKVDFRPFESMMDDVKALSTYFS